MTLGDRAREAFEVLQDRICERLETIDGHARFREDRWDYRPGRTDHEDGGGRTRVLEGGAVFEKAGVNLSAVRGALTAAMAAHLGVDETGFFATGISLVVHPVNPHVPTVHMNLRYFRVASPAALPDAEPLRQWFGGGADLTPYLLDEDDARHFHAILKAACDRHDPRHYPRFKRWCDTYFRNPHRGEARGVGGLFFDDLDRDPEATFAFVRDVGDAFLPAYATIVERNLDRPSTDAERRWQLQRRGRYVEFNLLHDRGTGFGLETGGRIESIFMSLPPLVRWDYDARDTCGPAADALLAVLREPREWVESDVRRP